MNISVFDSGNDGACSGVGLVNLSKIFVGYDEFLMEQLHLTEDSRLAVTDSCTNTVMSQIVRQTSSSRQVSVYVSDFLLFIRTNHIMFTIDTRRCQIFIKEVGRISQTQLLHKRTAQGIGKMH